MSERKELRPQSSRSTAVDPTEKDEHVIVAENDRKEQAPKLDATDATIPKPAKKASKSQPTLATIFVSMTFGECLKGYS